MEHPEMDMYAYERFLADGKTPFCGVDEAGRGPLAGPVCAAAVLLPEGLVIPGLNDSKKLTAKKRDALYDIICESAMTFGIAFATVEEIEALNIKGATYLAMNRAVADMEPAPVLALVDGNDKNELDIPAIKVVKGDSLCASRRPRCLPRSRETGIWMIWTHSIPSTALPGIRATARRRTMPRFVNTARRRSTARRI